jgi:Winged helix-turn helix
VSQVGFTEKLEGNSSVDLSESPRGTCLLSPEQQAQRQQALEEPPADGGLWTGPKVACWIESHTGRQVHAQQGWEYLKRLNYSSLPRLYIKSLSLSNALDAAKKEERL